MATNTKFSVPAIPQMPTAELQNILIALRKSIIQINDNVETIQNSRGSSSSTIGPIKCIPTGGPNTIALTPEIPVTNLNDGDQFWFVPTATTNTTAIVTIQIVGLTGKITLKGSDGYSYALWHDIQKNKITTIRYSQALNVFTIQTSPMPFKQSIFGNGKVKLQSSGASTLSLTQDNGQALLLQNPITGGFRLCAVPTITNSNVFGSSNYVEGVANQALSANQLYSVYCWNTDGTNDQAVALDFYRMYTGVGAEAWTPTLNELGFYVKKDSIGGSTYDNSRTYVGQVWTGSSTIATVLNGTDLAAPVQSHYNRWRFPMMSSQVVKTGITTGSTSRQTTPTALVSNDGIEQCPEFRLHCNYKNSTAGMTGTISLKIEGTSFNGAAFNATSPVAKFTTPIANYWGQINTEWGVAVPQGVFSVFPLLTVDGGSGTFELDLMVTFAS